MPTGGKVRQALLAVLPQEVDGRVYELGVGWGTLLLPLARRYANCTVAGYETSPVPYVVAKIRLWLAELPNGNLRRRDFFTVDMRDAGLVVCYLYPGAMQRLKDKFERELKPGCWVVSHTFAVPGWQACTMHEVDDLYRTKIYLYRMPM